MSEIIAWIDTHNGSLVVIITFVYVVATVFICIYSKESANAAHESVVEAQKALKKSIDLQVYERMIQLASNLERNDYSNTTMEISVLFGVPIWKQVEKLKKLLSDLDMWEKNRKKYTKLCEAEGYDYELDWAAEQEGASAGTVKEAQTQSEKFAVLFDYTSFNPAVDPEPDRYDWHEISTSIDSLENEISTRQKQLKKEVYKILKSKITVD